MRELTTKNNNQEQEKTAYDVLCFSHLRWDFVFQRPQHLLTRFAQHGHRVFFIEEPVFTDVAAARLEISPRQNNLFIVFPQFPHGTDGAEIENILRRLLDELLANYQINNFISWYYTPMMLSWSSHLEPQSIVFDSMDELSLFKFAPPALLENETKLLESSDVVFTGGQSLFEAKRERHHNIHAFPSSIEVEHFAKALEITDDPSDQASIPHPRMGFYGVIDERTDIELLGKIADLKPDYQFIMLGPIVKIDDNDLPRRANIHYLGGKKYEELPAYLASWDVAMMPFAMNESTRFISPTKTPEFLAAGKTVVSTPIRDVVRPYGEKNLTYIAETPEEFVAAIDKALNEDLTEHRQKANEFLADKSWDKTFEAMRNLIDEAIVAKQKSKAATA